MIRKILEAVRLGNSLFNSSIRLKTSSGYFFGRPRFEDAFSSSPKACAAISFIQR